MSIRFTSLVRLPLALSTIILAGFLLLPMTATAQEAEQDWLDIVRQTPYWESQGVAANLTTIRAWVLFSDSYCNEPSRHLLFGHRGTFLGYIEDGDGPETTTARLNETRARLAAQGRAPYWSPGSLYRSGYPFALACHQPFVDIDEAISRLTGGSPEYRVWGTWDGMSVGSADNQVSLVDLFRAVFEYREAQGRFTFPDSVMPAFLGKTIIESGGRKQALSPRDARGIMQLSPQVLDDCEIPEAFRLHRMAQVDCALRLVEQNHRNLEEPFQDRFGNLPAQKRDTLYDLLLTQAYLIGVGRTIELLQGEELGRAARYFADNHQSFSAEDILVGMIYHNLGRRDIGLRTLYYVTDARLAQAALCASQEMRDDPWCN